MGIARIVDNESSLLMMGEMFEISVVVLRLSEQVRYPLLLGRPWLRAVVIKQDWTKDRLSFRRFGRKFMSTLRRPSGHLNVDTHLWGTRQFDRRPHRGGGNSIPGFQSRFRPSIRDRRVGIVMIPAQPTPPLAPVAGVGSAVVTWSGDSENSR